MNGPTLKPSSLFTLGRALHHPSALRGRHIGKRLRELIILHVSSVNGCPVCSRVHAVIGRMAGLSRDQIAQARGCEPSERLDVRTQNVLRYAELRTRGKESDDPEVVARLVASFTPAQVREIDTLVDFFTFANRLNNTWERHLPRAEARRRRLGLCGESSE